MRMLLPINGTRSRPLYLANHTSPYICGKCGHECTSVGDQAKHMHAEHPDFIGQIEAHTGIGQGPGEVAEKFGHYSEVIEADPISLLHKMQRFISAMHIATNFTGSAKFVGPEYAGFLYQNVAYLEKVALEYPTAPEIYENIARGAQLLNRERMAADYWSLAIEVDVAFDRRILQVKDRLAINQTMARIGDEENSYLACTYPYLVSISGLFAKSLFKKSYPEVVAWPSRRAIKPMINSLRKDPSARVKQGFRGALAEFRYIKSHNDATFEALMDGSLDDDDLDLDELDRLHGRIPVLIECLENCDYFVGAEKDYWVAHLQFYIAHRMARRGEIEEGLAAADKSIALFTAFESRSDYPNCIPSDLIQEYADGVVSNSVHAYLTKAGLYSQNEDYDEADIAYNASIQRANAPMIDGFYLVLALTKAGEHHLMRDNSKAIEYLSRCIELVESSGTNLVDTIEQGDLQLLKLKDTLMTAHKLAGNSGQADALKAEISPYEGYVSWRFEGNIFDENDDSA